MQYVKKFNELTDRFCELERVAKVALICPDDEASLHVISRCVTERLADFILIDSAPCPESIKALDTAYPGHIQWRIAPTPDEAARLGVDIIRTGQADVLMKGIINTDNLMRAILNKEHGLLPPGNILTHITVCEIPSYHKLLAFSDATVIPYPTLEQYDAMVRYNVELAHTLGIESPKVALIHFTEKVNPKFQNTIDYVELKHRAAAGKYGNAVVDGPIDVKTAVDLHSSQVKGIITPVAGDADILIFPDLEAGNTFYKTVSFFGNAVMAGIVIGASAPIVLPSRADSAESKFYSLALACLALRHYTTT